MGCVALRLVEAHDTASGYEDYLLIFALVAHDVAIGILAWYWGASLIRLQDIQVDDSKNALWRKEGATYGATHSQ